MKKKEDFEQFTKIYVAVLLENIRKRFILVLMNLQYIVTVFPYIFMRYTRFHF